MGRSGASLDFLTGCTRSGTRMEMIKLMIEFMCGAMLPDLEAPAEATRGSGAYGRLPLLAAYRCAVSFRPLAEKWHGASRPPFAGHPILRAPLLRSLSPQSARWQGVEGRSPKTLGGLWRPRSWGGPPRGVGLFPGPLRSKHCCVGCGVGKGLVHRGASRCPMRWRRTCWHGCGLLYR